VLTLSHAAKLAKKRGGEGMIRSMGGDDVFYFRWFQWGGKKGREKKVTIRFNAVHSFPSYWTPVE